ncbi:MAG: hypothetical protein CMJ78_22055 [Planctomycetaceae bacterium]|nr:hypothetical protein [Planctomycetaceae bacterium]
MSSGESTTSNKASLKDLIALNDEIAALVRVGVPLELGLSSLGGSVTGELKKLSEQISGEMAGGKSLPDALEASQDVLPELYKAIVECGLKTGRLPEALENLSAFAQSMLELRRRITIAMLYPMAVLLVAYGLFMVFLWEMVPRLAETYMSLQLPAAYWLEVLLNMRGSLPLWGPLFPLLLIVLYFLESYSQNSLLTKSGLIPGVGPILRNYHLANFADLLSMLIGHQVPLAEAFSLAARATGRERFVSAAETIGKRLKEGKSLTDSLKGVDAIPSFMAWMMVSAEAQASMPRTLKQIADLYRRRAAFQADWFKMMVPIFLIVIVAGGATLLYALSLFAPLSELLRRLDAA